MSETTRRSMLGRGLVLLTGLAGLGAAGVGRLASGRDAGPDSASLVLYGRHWRGHSRRLRPGELDQVVRQLDWHSHVSHPLVAFYYL